MNAVKNDKIGWFGSCMTEWKDPSDCLTQHQNIQVHLEISIYAAV